MAMSLHGDIRKNTTEGSPHCECHRRVTTGTAVANTLPESKDTYTTKWQKAGQLGLGPGQKLAADAGGWVVLQPSILENLHAGTETSWLGV